MTIFIERIKKFAASLQNAYNKEDPFELDTDGIAVFIQDTQTWLINHLSSSCFPLLKDCLDISNKETIARVQIGLKIAFERIANVFEASEIIFLFLKLDVVVNSSNSLDHS